jgi:hypothetical protein
MIACAACGSSASGIHPTSALGTTTDAQKAFADIRTSFVDSSRGRAAVRLALERFLEKYPNDGLAPLAHSYLAHVLLDLGDDREAAKHVGVLLDVRFGANTPPGTAGDLAALALGRLWRRQGKAEEAYALLRTLVGKLLDPWARAILDGEVTYAALDARYEYEALAYMDTWLRDVSDEDREAVRERIRTLLDKIARQSLEGAFRGMIAQGSAGYGIEVRRLVAERLAKVATTENDPRLARWLLDVDSAGRLIPTDLTLALQDVASAKRGELAVAGRSIGLVLPTSKPTVREAAADVARGAAYALGLPRTDPGAGDMVQLVTKSDAGALGVALEELAGEGAALVIAGFDSAGANDALAFAERRQVPVITLAMPSAPPSKWAFVLGESESTELGLLENELRARKIQKSGLVLSDLQLTKAALEHPLFVPPRGCDFRAGDLGGTHAWTVVAPPSCSQRLQSELARGATIGLSLEAVTGNERPSAGVTIYAIVAGRFPARANDTELASYAQHFGGKPTWWTALGRDAAIIGKAAVKSLPTDQTQSPTEVARRREAVRAALEAASVDLWSTEERGFRDHVMPRKLRVETLK